MSRWRQAAWVLVDLVLLAAAVVQRLLNRRHRPR